jgi:two-component system, OmpR family, sensor kinase
MSSALNRIPIRWRLAVVSSALTFVILCAFAVAVGQLTASRVRSDFNNGLAAAVDNISDQFRIVNLNLDDGTFGVAGPNLDVYGAGTGDEIRVLAVSGKLKGATHGAPNFGLNIPRTARIGGFRVETRERLVPVAGSHKLTIPIVIQYARKVSNVESTVQRIRFFLILGVLGGTGLAFLAGFMLARQAMRPIAALTATAREITRTRDPGRSVPVPNADDEVGELARTLDEMLRGLEASRVETEGMLTRQRQFVADASHELRTPLTSVLANLELLAEVLEGERGEAARSALRSSRRMRRLVGDLLLLARADSKRLTAHVSTDLSQVLVEAAAELGPMAEAHELTVDPRPAFVDGAHDELHRLALNLMENALRHTPPGTRVRAAVGIQGDDVVLVVEDDGPGVPAAVRDRIFERFVRGDGDRGTSSGLGLSIVRAVADSHSGTVTLEDAHPGARFVVRFPRAQTLPAESEPTTPAGAPV